MSKNNGKLKDRNITGIVVVDHDGSNVMPSDSRKTDLNHILYHYEGHKVLVTIQYVGKDKRERRGDAF